MIFMSIETIHYMTITAVAIVVATVTAVAMSYNDNFI